MLSKSSRTDGSLFWLRLLPSRLGKAQASLALRSLLRQFTDAQCTARMLHKEIKQTLLWQLRQVSEHFIRYQMEATGLRL